MDREACRATVHGSQSVGHDWVTITFTSLSPQLQEMFEHIKNSSHPHMMVSSLQCALSSSPLTLSLMTSIRLAYGQYCPLLKYEQTQAQEVKAFVCLDEWVFLAWILVVQWVPHSISACHLHEDLKVCPILSCSPVKLSQGGKRHDPTSIS